MFKNYPHNISKRPFLHLLGNAVSLDPSKYRRICKIENVDLIIFLGKGLTITDLNHSSLANPVRHEGNGEELWDCFFFAFLGELLEVIWLPSPGHSPGWE